MFGKNKTKESKTPEFKYGKVELKDFDLSKNFFDTTADAVIIFHDGDCTMQSKDDFPFALWYTIKKRYKILNEAGKKLANQSFVLEHYGQSNEKIKSFGGNTYNIENGKIVKHSMAKNDFFYDKQSENMDIVKFTLPKVQVGSIIEYEYTYVSDFYSSIPDWNFQQDYPILWSSFSLNTYEIFQYLAIPQGLYKFHDKGIVRQQNASLGFQQRYGHLMSRHWVMKDLPATVKEDLLYNVDNYRSQLEFELHNVHITKDDVYYRKDWKTFNKYIIEDPSWYKPFYNSHIFMKKMTKEYPMTDTLTLVKNMFYKIRDEFETTYSSSILPRQLPAAINRTKKGSAAEINLFLISLLRQYGLDANPVLLNTRANGKPITDIPCLTRLNYLIVHIEIGGKEYYLDASKQDMQFNHLPIYCYNGMANIVNSETAKQRNLSANNIVEKNEIKVALVLGSEDNWEASLKEKYSYYSSMNIRKRIRKSGLKKVEEALKKELDIDNDELSFELKQNEVDTFLYEGFAKWNFENNKAGDLMYLNPFIKLKSTPKAFKNEKRILPVEFRSAKRNAYIVSIKTPEGYDIESAPEARRVKLDGDSGEIFVNVDKGAGQLDIISFLKINQAVYLPQAFTSLKQFFTYYNSLKDEVIVFKKK